MSVSVITKKIEARTVTIKLSDGSLVQGKVNLHRNDIDIQRVSDLFIKVADPFIVVFGASMEEGETGRVFCNVLILNKNSIVWISPEDDPRQEDKLTHHEDVKPKEPNGGSLLDRLRSI